MFVPGLPPAQTEVTETPSADAKRNQYQARGMGKGKGCTGSTLYLGSTAEEKTPCRRQLTELASSQEEFPDNQLGVYPESQQPPPSESPDAPPKVSPASKAAPASGAASLEDAARMEAEAIDKTPAMEVEAIDKTPMESMNGNVGGESIRGPVRAKLPPRPTSSAEPSGSSMYEDGTYWRQLGCSGLVDVALFHPIMALYRYCLVQTNNQSFLSHNVLGQG